jgi:hypothetical protein
MTVESTTAAPEAGATPALSSSEDLFALGRRAIAARDAALGGRGTFATSRRLLGTGAWRGPQSATISYVEGTDLAALGGWAAAHAAGATTLVGADLTTLAEASRAGARVVARVPYRAGETDVERKARLRVLADSGLPIFGVIPTPEGEPYGLDTLRITALCRLELASVPHVVADVEALGPRLAQMCFGFGADELHAPIVGERALRLGDNANNPALTRKEAVTLIRGAGLRPAERLPQDRLQDLSQDLSQDRPEELA